MRISIAVLGVAFLALTGCGEQSKELEASSPDDDCASAQTEEALKDKLFQKLLARSGNVATLSDLKTGTVVRLEDAVVDQRNDTLKKTICSGRLVVDLPPGSEVAGGPNEMASEVRYSVQQSASGTGKVYSLFGVEPLLSQLTGVGAAAPASQSANLPATGNQPLSVVPQSNYHPSFRCSSSNTNVEKMICGSPELAALDRQGSSQYDKALRFANWPGGRTQVRDFQRQFLRDRDACRTTVCIAEAYRAHLDNLRNALTAEPESDTEEGTPE